MYPNLIHTCKGLNNTIQYGIVFLLVCILLATKERFAMQSVREANKQFEAKDILLPTPKANILV